MRSEQTLSRVGWSWCALAVVGLTGCPDPSSRFEEFNERYTELHPPVVSELCEDNPCAQPAAGPLGSYLWTISTELYPPSPVLFHAVLTTAATADGLELSFTAAPLSSEDRSTEVEEPTSYGPIAVSPSGCFTSPTFTMTAPGVANPISGSDLAADIALEGQLCADTPIICGKVTGAITAPLQYPLTKSTFTFYPELGPGEYPEPPVINCDGDLAAAL